MSKTTRFSRLPVIPSWERLLTRFYTISEATPANLATYFGLLGALSSNRYSILQQIGRLATTLPKITGLEVVGIFQLCLENTNCLAANISPNRIEMLMSQAVFKRELKEVTIRKRLSGLVGTRGKKSLRHIVIEPLGRYLDLPVVLVGLSSRAIPQEEAKFTELVAQIIRLRFGHQHLDQKLTEHKNQFQTLVQHLSEGMIILNNDLRVSLWNRPMEKITGCGVKDVVGKPFEEAILCLNKNALLESLNQAIATKGADQFGIIVEVVARKDTKLWLRLTGSILRQRDGKVERVIIIAHDVSKEKLLEQKKNEFISIATHEFRTPLTVIRDYLSLLDRGEKKLDERQRRYLRRVTEASDRLVNLTEDLLQVAQIDQDRLEIKNQTFDLFRVLKKICHDFKAKANQKGVSLTIARPTFSTYVSLDPVRCEQIFSNLVDNALKYTLRGSVKIFFEEITHPNQRQTSLIVHIKDTGIGIAKVSLEEIFEKFRRTHKIEEIREQGAGLGLFIVKSFVDRQQGTIDVRSRHGQGTTFSITFPLANLGARARTRNSDV